MWESKYSACYSILAGSESLYSCYIYSQKCPQIKQIKKKKKERKKNSAKESLLCFHFIPSHAFSNPLQSLVPQIMETMLFDDPQRMILSPPSTHHQLVTYQLITPSILKHLFPFYIHDTATYTLLVLLLSASLLLAPLPFSHL